MLDQSVLDLALLGLIRQAEKVEAIGVFERLACQVGLRLGQALVEVGDGAAAALAQAGFDLHHQHIARPVVLDGLGGVPAALQFGLQLGQQHQVMPPRQLSNSLLDKFGIRPRLGKSAHVHQVGPRKPFHRRKGQTQIVLQPLDHLRAPALIRLPRQDVPSDLPVQQHQFAVNRQRGTLLGAVDAGFELQQPVGVTLRQGYEGGRLVIHARALIPAASLAATP